MSDATNGKFDENVRLLLDLGGEIAQSIFYQLK
jgi:hypothetical protein